MLDLLPRVSESSWVWLPSRCNFHWITFAGLSWMKQGWVGGHQGNGSLLLNHGENKAGSVMVEQRRGSETLCRWRLFGDAGTGTPAPLYSRGLPVCLWGADRGQTAQNCSWIFTLVLADLVKQVGWFHRRVPAKCNRDQRNVGENPSVTIRSLTKHAKSGHGCLLAVCDGGGEESQSTPMHPCATKWGSNRGETVVMWKIGQLWGTAALHLVKKTHWQNETLNWVICHVLKMIWSLQRVCRTVLLNSPVIVQTFNTTSHPMNLNSVSKWRKP